MILLQGLRATLFLMSEVPLYHLLVKNEGMPPPDAFCTSTREKVAIYMLF